MLNRKKNFVYLPKHKLFPGWLFALGGCGGGALVQLADATDETTDTSQIDIQLSSRKVIPSSMSDYIYSEQSNVTTRMLFVDTDFDIDGDKDIVAFDKNDNQFSYVSYDNGYFVEDSTSLDIINSSFMYSDPNDATQTQRIISFYSFDVNGDNKDDFLFLKNTNYGDTFIANNQELDIRINMQSIPSGSTVVEADTVLDNADIVKIEEQFNSAFLNNFTDSSSIVAWNEPATGILGLVGVTTSQMRYFRYINEELEEAADSNNPFSAITPGNDYIAKIFTNSGKQFLALSGSGQVRIFVYSTNAFVELTQAQNPFLGDTDIFNIEFLKILEDNSQNTITAFVGYTNDTIIPFQLTIDSNNNISRQLLEDSDNYLRDITDTGLIDFFYTNLPSASGTNYLALLSEQPPGQVKFYENQSSSYGEYTGHNTLRTLIQNETTSAVSSSSFSRNGRETLAIAENSGMITFYNISTSNAVSTLYTLNLLKQGVTKIDIKPLYEGSDDFRLLVSYDDGYVEIYKIIFDSSDTEKDFISSSSYFSDFIKIYAEKLSANSVKAVFVNAGYTIMHATDGTISSEVSKEERGFALLDAGNQTSQLRYFVNLYGNNYYENTQTFNPYEDFGNNVTNIASQIVSSSGQNYDELSLYKNDGSFYVASSSQIKQVATNVFSHTFNEALDESVSFDINLSNADYDISVNYVNSDLSDLFNISISSDFKVTISVNHNSNVLALHDFEDTLLETGLYFSVQGKADQAGDQGYIYVDIDITGSIDYGVPSRLGTAILSSAYTVVTNAENENLLQAFWSRTNTAGSNNAVKIGTNQLNEAIQITYSVATSLSYFAYSNTSVSLQNLVEQRVILTDQEQASFEAVIDKVVQRLDEVCGIEFIKVQDTEDSDLEAATFGDIRFSLTDQSVLPVVAATIDINTSSTYHASSDIWLSNERLTEFVNANEGDIFFNTLLHELGHAVGLRHLHPEDGITGIDREEAYDGLPYSVMSYNTYIGAPAASSINDTSSYTYMLDDITALQYAYGKNIYTGIGDDVYNFSGNDFVYETIWDVAGYDTIDWSNENSEAIINLSAGKHSFLGRVKSVNDPILDHLGRRINKIEDNPDGKKEGIFAIARDVTIERAYGGSEDDFIFGNEADNKLYGEGGNDILWGGGGRDILYGGSGVDRFYFRSVDGVSDQNDADVIMDFDKQSDILQLKNLNYSSLSITNVLDDTGGVLGAMVAISSTNTYLAYIMNVTSGDITIDRIDVDNTIDLSITNYDLL